MSKSETQNKKNGVMKMFNFFKKPATIYKVTYRFIGTEKTYTQTATSAGLASLDADWLIEILEVVKA